MKSLSPNKLASASGGGAVQSVNTQTGAVSLSVEDLDDFALNQSSNQTTAQWSTYDGNGNVTSAGEWYGGFSTRIFVNIQDDNGTDQSTFLSGLTTMWLSQDGTNFTEHTVQSISGTGSTRDIRFTAAHGLTTSGYVIIADQDLGFVDVALADGDILQYVSADSKFKPAQAAGVRSLLGIDEYADDTAAGTGGLSSGELYYNTTSSSYVLKA